MMNLNVSTLNLCLGLPSKKDSVTELLRRNNVNVCCLQETEIPKNFPEKVLDCGGYTLELELNSDKKRAGIYLQNDLNYVRRDDLEKEDFHIVIVDVFTNVKIRIINVYRSFRPPNRMTPDAFFVEQIKILSNALCNNCFVMGDFNLDARMSNRQDYLRKEPLKLLNDFALDNNLSQIIEFCTWSRTINGIKKESLLDHVYVNNPAVVNSVTFETPLFGDHVLIIVSLNMRSIASNPVSRKRSWLSYSNMKLKMLINAALAAENIKWCDLNVQEHWNALELVILENVDTCAPLVDIKVNRTNSMTKIPSSIKNKLNVRKRLLKMDRLRSTNVNAIRIRALNVEIKSFFVGAKTISVRRAAMGSKVNLWKAVKVAKNLNSDSIPTNLTLGGVHVTECRVAESFGNYFSQKINTNVGMTVVDSDGVYNGKCKLIVQNRNFMQKSDVELCMADLKNKNSEGYDRIPVCCLLDAREPLLNPMADLFSKIYSTGKIPEQWKVSKIIPTHKKGSKNIIENYRPIANLCSGSKIFEKLILKQIHYLESTNKLDLTGKHQHGFKRNKSTATAGALLQSIISRAADDKCYVVMASLDLSMAFDMVNTNLLIKRLRIMGMPNDIINLIREWLVGRSFYVQVGEDCSRLFDSDVGTIQGSILGPVLYAIFVSPLFDIQSLINFADDNFCVIWNRDLASLIEDLEQRLEMIVKWLRDSGLVVNEAKTEICLFHTNDQPLVTIMLQDSEILSKKSMNVLGVTFDSKLNWSIHVANSISKANKALFALRLIKKFFTDTEMRTLLDYNFYSILYYNAVIRLTPTLRSDLKQNLLTASACALRSCLMNEGFDISFVNLHKIHNKCTPEQIMYYQMSLKLHKLMNEHNNHLSFEHVTIMDQIVCTSRQINFQTFKKFNTKIGLNTTANKLFPLNNMIGLDSLNLKFTHYKKLAKLQFLKNGNT